MNLAYFIACIDVFLSMARATPPDVLLFVSLVAVLLFALFFVAWRRAMVRALTIERANARREVDLAVAHTALEYETKWRLAREASGAHTVNSPNNLAPKPPRELQQLLARENFDSKPAPDKLAIPNEELLGFSGSGSA